MPKKSFLPKKELDLSELTVKVKAIPFEKFLGDEGGLRLFKNAAGWSKNNSTLTAWWSKQCDTTVWCYCRKIAEGWSKFFPDIVPG